MARSPATNGLMTDDQDHLISQEDVRQGDKLTSV